MGGKSKQAKSSKLDNTHTDNTRKEAPSSNIKEAAEATLVNLLRYRKSTNRLREKENVESKKTNEGKRKQEEEKENGE